MIFRQRLGSGRNVGWLLGVGEFIYQSQCGVLLVSVLESLP